ncbi:hypothetical protein C8Q78DRAFT_149188 [Trametes maxima]|nr:hypothetical protein C8Q78DRAFT_149188 [Trametes maxima]
MQSFIAWHAGDRPPACPRHGQRCISPTWKKRTQGDMNFTLKITASAFAWDVGIREAAPRPVQAAPMRSLPTGGRSKHMHRGLSGRENLGGRSPCRLFSWIGLNPDLVSRLNGAYLYSASERSTLVSFLLFTYRAAGKGFPSTSSRRGRLTRERGRVDRRTRTPCIHAYICIHGVRPIRAATETRPKRTGKFARVNGEAVAIARGECSYRVSGWWSI